MVMARVHRTPVKDGKKSRKMKKVIICEARHALLGGWKFIIRLIWRRDAITSLVRPEEQAKGAPARHQSPDSLPITTTAPPHPISTTTGSYGTAKPIGSNFRLTHIFDVEHDEKSNHLDKGQQRTEEGSNPMREWGWASEVREGTGNGLMTGVGGRRRVLRAALCPSKLICWSRNPNTSECVWR